MHPQDNTPPHATPAAHNQDSDDYLTKARLRTGFGLTDTLIARLGPHDRTAPNPYYKNAAPVQLYARERVIAWVTAHAEEVAAAARRSQVRKDVAQRQAQQLVAAAEQMPILVQAVDPAVLQDNALASYNYAKQLFALEREDFDWLPATRGSNPAFLERITVNYIRHELTSYDRELEQLVGKVGVDRAMCVIRRRVYAAIAEVYPQYADECQRQLDRRTEAGD